MEFITSKDTEAKVARLFGLDEPSVLDALDRAQYASDESYLDAAVKMTLERRSPEYTEIRRRLKRELEERREKEVRTENAEEYKRIRSNVKLDNLDVKNIDVEATELARRDLAEGRISASGMGKAIEQYAEKLSEKRMGERAANQFLNNVIRGTRL